MFRILIHTSLRRIGTMRLLMDDPNRLFIFEKKTSVLLC
jgi:hypothetical protein